MNESRHKPYYEYIDGCPAKMKPRFNSRIKYLSSDENSKCGTLYVSYKENGKLKRKSWSWHVNGRTHYEAFSLAEEFLNRQDRS